MKRRLPPFRGFTLTELLVCIAIIALLAILLFPMMQGSLSKANRVKCLNNLRQIQAACISYAGENDGLYPVATRQYGFPHEFKNYDDTIGLYLKAPREKTMFCQGELLRVRNSKTNLYDTTYTTYQYFNNPDPFVGVFSSGKPNMTRTTTAPVNVPLWGCLTAQKGGKTMAHSEPANQEPITGMNVVYPDGHAAWFNSADLELYLVKEGLSCYWPKPEPLE